MALDGVDQGYEAYRRRHYDPRCGWENRPEHCAAHHAGYRTGRARHARERRLAVDVGRIFGIEPQFIDDEQKQCELTRYYMASRAGGVTVGVHNTT